MKHEDSITREYIIMKETPKAIQVAGIGWVARSQVVVQKTGKKHALGEFAMITFPGWLVRKYSI